MIPPVMMSNEPATNEVVSRLASAGLSSFRTMLVLASVLPDIPRNELIITLDSARVTAQLTP